MFTNLGKVDKHAVSHSRGERWRQSAIKEGVHSTSLVLLQVFHKDPNCLKLGGRFSQQLLKQGIGTHVASKMGVPVTLSQTHLQNEYPCCPRQYTKSLADPKNTSTDLVNRLYVALQSGAMLAVLRGLSRRLQSWAFKSVSHPHYNELERTSRYLTSILKAAIVPISKVYSTTCFTPSQVHAGI